jgi:anti-sigma factor ChrR (cupin superfamily)
MMPDQWTARLSEYVDDELDAAERRALEAHLIACSDCRETVAELRRVALKAGALTDREPAADLWPGIARRIGAPVEVAGRARPVAPQRWSFTMPQLAAAALLLAAVGAGGFWAAQRAMTGDRTPVATGEPVAPTEGVRVALRDEESTRDKYDRAVAELQQVLAQNRSRLDTATVRVLEESLATIDRALARARAALSQDPSDAYLNAHLAETMRRKIDLLRRAAALATASS